MNLFIVSPHRDDAAFSLSLAMYAWTLAGHKLTLINLFTQTAYAPYAPLQQGLRSTAQPYISALRMREDETFLRHFADARRIDLALEDAPLRLECDLAALCDLSVTTNDPALSIIHASLQKCICSSAATQTALVLPLALGGHIDHQAARDAALPSAAGLPCAFYEDLPYATRARAGSDLARIRAQLDEMLNAPLRPVLCGRMRAGAVSWKRQAVMCYPSQLCEEEAETIARFCERYDGAERLWVNDAWLTLAEGARLSTPWLGSEAEPSV